MRELLTTPKEVACIRKATAELLGEMSRKVNTDIDERRQRLKRTEQRIAGLVTFIADGDHSDYVRSRYAEGPRLRRVSGPSCESGEPGAFALVLHR